MIEKNTKMKDREKREGCLGNLDSNLISNLKFWIFSSR